MRSIAFTAPCAVLAIMLWFVRAESKPDPNPVVGNPASSPVSVILISVDGLRPDAITKLGANAVPHFYRLRREGAFTDNARTAKDYTVTLPNHTGMITSRLVTGPEGHNWTINRDTEFPPDITLHKQKGSYLDSVFAGAHDYGFRTALFASKSKFSLFDVSYDSVNGAEDQVAPDNGRDKIDVFEFKNRSENIVDHLERAMKKDVFDFLMLHIRNPDTAGHVFKWNTAIPSPYMASVRKVDELLGDVFEQIDSNSTWRGRTYLVVTADHGGATGEKQHKENENAENYTIPFYVWGPGIPAGADLYALNPNTRKDPGSQNPALDQVGQPIRNAGAGNLCLDLLGIPAISGSTVNSNQDLSVRALVQ